MVAICHLAPGRTAHSPETEGESIMAWVKLAPVGCPASSRCSSVLSDQTVCFHVAEAQHFTVLKRTTRPRLRSFPRTDVCFQRNLCLLWKLRLIYPSLPTPARGSPSSPVTVSVRGGDDVLVPGEKAAELNGRPGRVATLAP